MRVTLLNMVFGSVSFDLSAVCGTCLPGGCAVATHSLGNWTESAEGDPDSLWGRSPHLAEARSGFWKGERASEGRGCFERLTLNADRKANRKGAALFNGPSWREFKSQLRKLEMFIHKLGGRMTRSIAAWMLIARPIASPLPSFFGCRHLALK